MAGLEHVAGGRQVQDVLIRLAGVKQCGLVDPGTVLRPNNAVGDIARVAARVRVHQFGRESVSTALVAAQR